MLGLKHQFKLCVSYPSLKSYSSFFVLFFKSKAISIIMLYKLKKNIADGWEGSKTVEKEMSRRVLC